MPKDANPVIGRDEARARAKAMREQALKSEARRGKVILGSIIGAVIAIAIVVVVLIVNNSSVGKLVVPKGISVAAASTAGSVADPVYTVPVVSDTALKPKAPTVLVYIDFQCPVCKQFEATNAEKLNAMAASGDIALQYQVRSFLGDYSKRAGNAAMCVVDQNPKLFTKFAAMLYASQPDEQLADNQKPQASALLDLAKSAGATDDVTDCISTNRFGKWIDDSDADASKKSSGTPTIFINGKRLTDAQMGSTLQDASVMTGLITAASGAAPAATTPAK